MIFEPKQRVIYEQASALRIAHIATAQEASRHRWEMEVWEREIKRFHNEERLAARRALRAAAEKARRLDAIGRDYAGQGEPTVADRFYGSAFQVRDTIRRALRAAGLPTMLGPQRRAYLAERRKFEREARDA